MNFEQFCGRVEHLRLDSANGVVKPYKPLMLMALLVLVGTGKQRERFVALDGGMKSLYLQLLSRLQPDWPYRADVRDPFRALENDGVWRLIPIDGAVDRFIEAQNAKARARDVMKHVACAELDPKVFDALGSSGEARLRVLSILLATYEQCLPANAGTEIIKLLAGQSAPLPIAGAHSLPERVVEEELTRRWSRTPFHERGVSLSHRYPNRQVVTKVGTIDVLGFHKSEKAWWVFELKRNRPPDAVVGQVSRYMGWLRDERRSFGESVLGAILASEVNEKLRYAVAANDRLTLWRYDDQLQIHQVT